MKGLVGNVQVVDVGGVVLGVVKFHDISRDKWLERVVLVWQLWKSCLGSSAENAEDSRSHHFFSEKYSYENRNSNRKKRFDYFGSTFTRKIYSLSRLLRYSVVNKLGTVEAN